MASRRQSMTLADYVVIAISPVLIMVLVGSLTFFLLEIGYSGQYEGRLMWILFWFVMAAVLITRISIEEGAEKASLYGVALAAATALAVLRFVDSPLVALLLMGLIWWCSHKLTFDCTLIDDTQDASGQGLLQVAGLDSDGEVAEPTAVQAGHGGPETSGSETSSSERGWRRWFGHRSKQPGRPHAPGLWVVYFSLAALPLFGLGQALIPAAEMDRRRYAFWLLCWYVASALGLLLTTSFLGLRRYLRQRKLKMPLPMTSAWLTVGGVLIGVLLLVGALLPRSTAEYKLEDVLGERLGSPNRSASRYAMLADNPGQGPGRPSAPADAENVPEKPKDETQDQQAPQSKSDPPGPQQSESGQSGSVGGRGSSSGESKQPAPGDQGAGQKRSDEADRQDGAKGQTPLKPSEGEQRREDAKPADEDGSRQDTADGNQNTQSQGAAKPEDAQRQREENQKRKPQSQSPPPGNSNSEPAPPPAENGESRGSDVPPDEPEQEQEEPEKPADEKEQAEKQDDSQSSGASPSTPPSKPWLPDPSTWSLASWIRWLFYGAMIAAAIWATVRHWKQVVQFLRNAIQELKLIWRNLMALLNPKHKTAAGAAAAEAVVPAARPFAAFGNPFQNGSARGWETAEVVRYTFEAMQAWASERGTPRRHDETPLEYARRITGALPQVGAEAREVAELYIQVAYARGSLGRDALAPVRRLWERLSAASQFAGASL